MNTWLVGCSSYSKVTCPIACNLCLKEINILYCIVLDNESIVTVPNIIAEEINKYFTTVKSHQYSRNVEQDALNIKNRLSSFICSPTTMSEVLGVINSFKIKKLWSVLIKYIF